jgi:hypothetical protein
LQWRGQGSILERSEDLILFQAISKVACTFSSDLVAHETANKSQNEVSEAANACVWEGHRVVHELGEGLVLLEALSKILCAFRSNFVASETASKRTDRVSELRGCKQFGGGRQRT